MGTNPKENLDAAASVYAKHLELGADSPLNILDDVDWSVIGPKIAPTLASQVEAEFMLAKQKKNIENEIKQCPKLYLD